MLLPISNVLMASIRIAWLPPAVLIAARSAGGTGADLERAVLALLLGMSIRLLLDDVKCSISKRLERPLALLAAGSLLTLPLWSPLLQGLPAAISAAALVTVGVLIRPFKKLPRFASVGDLAGHSGTTAMLVTIGLLVGVVATGGLGATSALLLTGLLLACDAAVPVILTPEIVASLDDFCGSSTRAAGARGPAGLPPAAEPASSPSLPAPTPSMTTDPRAAGVHVVPLLMSLGVALTAIWRSLALSGLSSRILPLAGLGLALLSFSAGRRLSWRVKWPGAVLLVLAIAGVLVPWVFLLRGTDSGLPGQEPSLFLWRELWPASGRTWAWLASTGGWMLYGGCCGWLLPPARAGHPVGAASGVVLGIALVSSVLGWTLLSAADVLRLVLVSLLLAPLASVAVQWRYPVQRSFGRLARGLLLLAAAVIAAVGPAEPPTSEAPGESWSRSRQILTDPHGTLVLTRSRSALEVRVNSAAWLSSGQEVTERFAAHLPLVLHPAPRSVLMLGGGTGAALSAATAHPLMSLILQESSIARLRLLPRLVELNQGSLEDPRVELRGVAASAVLARGNPRFDVVVQLLPPPVGIERERAFEAAALHSIRGALMPGGIAAFEVPIQVERSSLLGMLKSLAQVFPESLVWRSPGADSRLVVTSSVDPQRISHRRLEQAFSDLELRRALQRADLRDSTELLGRLLLLPEGLASIRARELELGRTWVEGSPTPAALGALLPALRPFAAHLAELPEGEERSILLAELDQALLRQRSYLTLLGQVEEGSYPDALESARLLAGDGGGEGAELSTLVAPYLEQARVFLGEGRFDRALEQLMLVRLFAPRHPPGQALLARTYALKGQTDKALRLYSEALAGNPDDIESALELADLLRASGRIAEGIQVLETSRTRAPSNAIVLHNIGVLNLAAGELRRAQARFEEAIRLEDLLAEAHAGLSETFFRQGRYDAAEDEAEIAARLKPTADHLNLLGQIYLRRGDLARARIALVQCLLKDPEHLEARGAMGILYAQAGDFARAREAWESVLAQNPDHPAARENLRQLEGLLPRRARP